MDSHGRTALGAADIERFYDGICPMLTCRALIDDGLDVATALAFARLHICVDVQFELPVRTLSFAARAGAVLTGTRTSIIAGRVVILDVGRAVAPSLKDRGLVFDNRSCSVLSFVDNFYALARCSFDAIGMLQALESKLYERWSLRFGDDSKMLLQVGRPVVDTSSSEPEYKTVAHMPVLGCTVSHNASVEECFSSCHKQMWRVFLANVGPSLLATDLTMRIRWLESSVLAIAAARWVTWPCSATSDETS